MQQSQSPIIDTNTRRKYQLPDGGTWFHVQQPALDLVRQQGGFLVAWDKFDSGAKVYGVYEDVETFYDKLLAVSERCGYEIIPAETRCVLYLDVEWKGQEDSSHKRIRTVVSKLREYCQPKLKPGQNLKVYVCCGSRLGEDGSFKNSYHLAIPTVIFRNNHDQSMKIFVSKFCEQHEHDDWMFERNKKEELKCVVDLNVYSTNRCIRLPHCCKRGTSVPFARISGDPEDTSDSFVSHFDIHDHESWRPFLLSNPVQNEGIDVVEDPAPRGKKRGKVDAGVSKRQRTGAAETPSPVDIDQVGRALQQCGDQTTVVTKITCDEDDQGTYWRVQCDQKKKTRKCLADLSREHKSNNCLLFLRNAGGDKLCLNYHCLSERCKHRQNVLLGVFTMDPENNSWSFRLEGNKTQATDDNMISGSNTDGSEATDSAAVSEQKRKTYEMEKKDFEKTCFKIRDPFLYVRLEKPNGAKTTRVSFFKHSDLQNFYCDLTYDEKTVISEKQKPPRTVWVKKPFIPAWLRDKHKRQFSAIVVDPQGTRKDVFNLWTGYSAATEPRPLTFGEQRFRTESEAEDFVFTPIFRHILTVVANGDQEHANWILDWMANIVQRQWQKTQVAIMLYGRQGCGKGIIFAFFREHVLGAHHTFQTSNPERDLFDRFSQGFVNVSFVQVDEAENLHGYSEKIKDAVTNSTINMEKKNKDPVTVDSFVNILFTSNNENALKVSGDDRRTVMFRCNPVYKDNKNYFINLAAHLNLPGVAAWLYHILEKRDLSNYPYDFQASRPITEYYRESQNASISQEKRYLSAFINGEGPAEITSDSMYRVFKLWAETENIKFNIKQHSSFGRELCRVTGIKTQKTKRCNVYRIDFPKVKKYLEESKEYDEHAILHEECHDLLQLLVPSSRRFAPP